MTDSNEIIRRYDERAQAIQSLLCVGLDSDLARIPEPYRSDPQPRFAFNRWIIEQTHPFTSAYKINMAFYEQDGQLGFRELQATVEYLKEHHPDIVVIADAKRGDIGNTNQAYATAIFDELGFDAVTLHPYLGQEALAPFLTRQDKACIILCRTSNPGAGELQDMLVGEIPLWQVVAEKVVRDWNSLGNCMLVVGATYPDELQQVRAIAGDMTLLVPGVGAQGGDLQATLQAGLNSQGRGLMLSVSRSVIFSENPAEAAKGVVDAMRRYHV